MITKVANLPDRSVRYLEAGQGRALVLIHGFPFSAEMWLPQLHRPPLGWRVVAPDLRGFRGTAMTPGVGVTGLDDITMDGYGADVFALMTHLEIDRGVVCGLSMGGYVAFAMAAQAPRRIAGLVLANTRAAADSAEARAGRDRMLAVAQREGAAGVARDMLPKLLGETTKREQPDLIDAVRGLIEANSVEGISAGLRALKTRPDRTSELGSIACPTLIVAGDEDAIIPMADTAVMHRGIAGADLVVLPRVGHLSSLEDPLGFNRALEKMTSEVFFRNP